MPHTKIIKVIAEHYNRNYLDVIADYYDKSSIDDMIKSYEDMRTKKYTDQIGLHLMNDVNVICKDLLLVNAFIKKTHFPIIHGKDIASAIDKGKSIENVIYVVGTKIFSSINNNKWVEVKAA